MRRAMRGLSAGILAAAILGPPSQAVAGKKGERKLQTVEGKNPDGEQDIGHNDPEVWSGPPHDQTRDERRAKEPPLNEKGKLRR